jgi:hypothetical protein
MNRASITYRDWGVPQRCNHHPQLHELSHHSPPEVDHMCIDLSAPMAVEEIPAIVTWLQ